MSAPYQSKQSTYATPANALLDSTTGASILALDLTRLWYVIRNTSASANVYLAFSDPAGAITEALATFVLGPGEALVSKPGDTCGPVWGTTSAGSFNVRVTGFY